MRSVGSHSTSGMEKEGKKERTIASNGVPVVRVVHGAMGCDQKSFKLVWWCHQVLSGFLANGYLPRVSRQSRRSLMIRVVVKWSWGLCTDLLAIALQPRKTPENLSLETVWWRGCATSHRLKWDTFPPNEVGRIAQHVRNGEGRKKGKDGCLKWDPLVPGSAIWGIITLHMWYFNNFISLCSSVHQNHI
jgi:hypothetical protein